jgi:hypothetical protein
MKMLRVLAALAAFLLPAAAFGQAMVGSGQVWGNSTATRAPAKSETVTAILDRALGSTRGALIERGASAWGLILPGTAGLALVSGGAGGDPSYAILGLSGGGCNAALTASNGGVLYSTASACAILAGTANASRPLLSGSSAAPSWAAFSLPGSVTSGGIPYFSSTSAMASSAALTANALVLGGGAGAAPSTPVGLGTTTTVLHGNAAGAPSFAAVSNSDLSTGAANTVKGSVNGTTTTDLAVASCSALYSFTQWVTGTGWQCGFIPVLPSRATAATLNLSAFSAVQTQGYASPGDGGGAMFQKLAGGVQFRDTNISSAVLVGGSGYTNGNYFTVPLTGGSGANCFAFVAVSGGAVTSVSRGAPCTNYKSGDVLTTPNSFIGGTGSGFTWTVNGLTTPSGSFTDTGSNKWQITTDSGNYFNVKQFGAKADWVLGVNDAGATNNQSAFLNAFYAAYQNDSHSPGNGSTTGAKIIVTPGNFMVCGGLNVPMGVWLSGQGVVSTMLKRCKADTTGINFITLCDITYHIGQFGCRISDMTLFSDNVNVTTTDAMVYSENGQQQTLVENVLIQPTGEGCFRYNTGWGGAANALLNNIDCELNQGSTATAMVFNASSTHFGLRESTIGCGGTGCPSATAIAINSGRMVVNTLDVEQFGTGLLMNNATAGNTSIYQNVQQNSNSCTQAITLSGTNIPSNTVFLNVATGCPKTILNGQTGGTDYTGTIRGALMCPGIAGGGTCSGEIP